MHFCNGRSPHLRSQRSDSRECPMPGYNQRLDTERLFHSPHESDTDGSLSFVYERPQMFPSRLYFLSLIHNS